MSEEQGTPTEHVSMGENGAIILSEEAQAVMEGIEYPNLDEEGKVDEATPAKPELPKVETRKIKHNGQEVEITPDKEIELLLAHQRTAFQAEPGTLLNPFDDSLFRRTAVQPAVGRIAPG